MRIPKPVSLYRDNQPLPKNLNSAIINSYHVTSIIINKGILDYTFSIHILTIKIVWVPRQYMYQLITHSVLRGDGGMRIPKTLCRDRNMQYRLNKSISGKYIYQIPIMAAIPHKSDMRLQL
jgi:hypothetical protein